MSSHPRTVNKLLQELIGAGLIERDENGVLFSSTILQDIEMREKAGKDGKKGGNPELKPKGLTPPLTGGG